MNPIERYRREHRLTYDEMARMVGLRSHHSVRNHELGLKTVSAETALLYEARLGIPRSELRPDLWPPKEERPGPDTRPIGWNAEEL